MDAAESIPVEELNEVRESAGSGHLLEGLHCGLLQPHHSRTHLVLFLQFRLTVRRDLQRAARRGLVQTAGLDEKLLA